METRINAHPHPGQAAVHSNTARFRVLAAGRRWGKTRLGVNECLDIAGHGGRAWWVAPNYRMSEVGWRPLKRIASQIGAEVRKVDRQIVLPGGGEIVVRSADNPDSLRGEGLDFVVLDETAFMYEEVWTEVLRPALSDRLGRAMFISTPKRRNWFYRLWIAGQQGNPEWKSWRLPTSDNPFISPAEIEAARESLPEDIFKQEYLAEFLENAGAVFRNLPACMGAPMVTIPGEHRDHLIVAGIDWAKQNDFTAISIGCATCHVELARDRFNHIDYIFQSGRIKVLTDYWHPELIMAESNAMGAPVIEQLQESGLPIRGFETTATSKPPLIENLALALERAEWQFQNDPIWLSELEAYERQVSLITGRSQYSAPVGVHDDTVMARALMLWAGMGGGKPATAASRSVSAESIFG